LPTHRPLRAHAYHSCAIGARRTQLQARAGCSGAIPALYRTPVEAAQMEQQDHPVPNSPASVEMVLRTIDDIDTQTSEHRDVLLADLLCASWGTVVAQNQ